MTTPGEVDAAIVDLKNQGMRSLIIDVRRNPGGLLEAAVDLADRFIEKGGIVTTRGRNGAENHSYTAHYANTLSLPLMVMIDEDSASASEIFAGAIRDNDRGLIVGRTSYGKGTVQGVFHNDMGNGGIRLTVSKFFAPSGYAISSRGIEPHVNFENASDDREVLVAKPAVAADDISMRSANRRVERIERQRVEDRDLQRAIVEARRISNQRTARAN
jgi:carboxyl-terminal processing protease